LARARRESALLDNRASHHCAAIGRSGSTNGHRIRGDAPVCERDCRLRSRTRLASCHPDRSEGSAVDQLQISRSSAHLGTISSLERTLACLVRNDHVCHSERSLRLTGKSSQRTSKSQPHPFQVGCARRQVISAGCQVCRTSRSLLARTRPIACAAPALESPR
jgi:hypothetical protein